MKIYTLTDGDFGQTLTRKDPDGKVWGIPLDPANSDYAEYLAYTAWVEAGNDPDEFWTKNDSEASE